MGCQTKIASEICNAGADYVLALKGNQSTLHEEVKIFLEGAEAGDFAGVHYDFLETNECAHGRIEQRRYWISEEIDCLTHYRAWEGLRSVGMVESTRESQGKTTFDCAQGTRTTERRFYIASMALRCGASEPTPRPSSVRCAATGPSRIPFIGLSM